MVFAFDSFKGSLSSLMAGSAAAVGARSVVPGLQSEVIPVADGGEGTVEALVSALGGEYASAVVTGPLSSPVEARYGLCGDIAVMEIAAASGLTLIAEEDRNPWLTSSFGTGELIRDAVSRGCRKFLIGLGGSAVNDAGTGMLRALGYRFLDTHGNEVPFGGGAIGDVVRIDSSGVLPQLRECSFKVACDVRNPLAGPEGASLVFAGQKGADGEMCLKLDDCLASFAEVTAAFLDEDFSMYPGAGAAGGLGFSFLAFLGAELVPGIDMVLDAVGFDRRIVGADLIFTGEGCLDFQTCMGKTPYGVLERAKRLGIPVIAVGGSLLPRAVPSLMANGFKAVFPILSQPCSLHEALDPIVASRNLERTVEQILRVLLINPECKL